MSINIWELDDAINLAPTLYSLNLDHELLTSSNDGNVWTQLTNQITWGLEGNDYLIGTTNKPNILIGGSGDDHYNGLNIVFEPRFRGTNDYLQLSYKIEDRYGGNYSQEYPSYYGYVNNDHVFLYRGDNPHTHTLIVNGLTNNGFENIQLLSYVYEPSILNDLQYYPNFVGNLDWEEYFNNYSSYIYLQDLSLTPENIEIVFDEIEKLNNLIDPIVNDGTAEFSIYGTPILGESLSPSPVKSDPDGTKTSTYSYSWQISLDNSTWTEVDSDYNYIVGKNDDNKFLRVVISYQDDQGFDEVIETSSISIPKADSGDAEFSIIGTKSVGDYLSIKRDSQDPDGTGKLSYQWQKSSDGYSWTDIGTKSSYRIKYDDSNEYLRAVVTYTDDDGFNESITTDNVQIDKHSIHTSIDSLRNQLSNLTYSTSFDFTSFGYSEEFGSSNGETLYASANEIVWGLGGDDSLKNSYSSYDQYLIGGSGNDTYKISGTAVAIIYEAPNQGTNDSLYLSSNYLYYGYAGSIDNKHIFAIYDDQAVFVIDAWENTGIENIYLGSSGYSSNYFLKLLPSLPGYLGNVSWDEIKPYAGDLIVNSVKSVIDEIKSESTNVETSLGNSQNSLNSQISSLESQASDLNQSTEEVLYTDQSIGTSYHLTAIRDYDGNFHANTGSVSDATKTSYKYQGLIDVNADGTKEAIYTNKESGRWVTASINSSTGEIDYSDHGQGGTTRVVGIYIDPLVTSGEVEQFGPHDSQRRFQNDLKIDNLIAKTSGDYDGDGFQEVYWKTNDGTAYLRALMHADGNIQYANYQNEEQMSDYLTSKGFESEISSII